MLSGVLFLSYSSSISSIETAESAFSRHFDYLQTKFHRQPVLGRIARFY